MTDDTKVTIDRIDMGTGWVCFQPGKNPPPPEKLSALLNRSVCTWLQRNPEFKVRAVLPLVESGNTIAIPCGSIEPAGSLPIVPAGLRLSQFFRYKL